jgi:hypothetical protein
MERPEPTVLCRALLAGSRPCDRDAASGSDLCLRCERLKGEVEQRYTRQAQYRDMAEAAYLAGEEPALYDPDKLRGANERAANLRLGPNPVIKQPDDNLYGRFKVLVRTDGLYIVFDPTKWPPTSPVYRTELDARIAALILVNGPRA